jgi:hypothetical protein
MKTRTKRREFMHKRTELRVLPRVKRLTTDEWNTAMWVLRDWVRDNWRMIHDPDDTHYFYESIANAVQKLDGVK